MNPHLNYMIARHRRAELQDAAAQARLAAEAYAGRRKSHDPDPIVRGERPPRANKSHGVTTLEIEPAIGASDEKHVVIVGAGFAGLELAARLSRHSRNAIRVTLIDQERLVLLRVLQARCAARPTRTGPTCFCTTATSPRKESRSARRPCGRSTRSRGAWSPTSGSYDADFLAIALGADYDMAATPGFREGGFEFYTLAGAERLREALAEFTEGTDRDRGSRATRSSAHRRRSRERSCCTISL